MKVTIIASPGARHQLQHQQAMAEGLRRHGIEATLSRHGLNGDTVICWGWRTGKNYRAAGKEVLVMERGYLGDRFAWTSLAWNGLNNRGTVHVPEDGGHRFSQFHELKPENPSGTYILIAGQVPGDAALCGRDLNPWYAEQAARDWRLAVKFRPHPLAYRRAGAVKPVPGAETINGELSDALAGAAMVVTFNSNTGVDALMAGKTATAEDEGSMIWGVTDRESWAHRLAWRQWTLDEIRDGSAWEVVTHGR